MELRVTIFLLSGLYTLSSSHEYQFVKITKTWAEAQSYCREKYIDLATIDNTEDMNTLREAMDDGSRGNNNRVWIGLHDNITIWKWSLDNSDYYTEGTEYGNWYANEPNNFGSSQYCVVIENNGHWNDRACEIHLYPVCYDANATNRYILGQYSMNWAEAQSYCRQHHTDLATVRNQTENQKIQDLVTTLEAWIGLSRVPWFWSDLSNSSFRLWGQFQPNNYLTSQYCVGINEETGLWDDLNCGEKCYFICHRESVLKQRTVVRMKSHSAADMTNPQVEQQVLQQLHDELKKQEVSDFKLSWTKKDGHIFHKEEEEEEKGKDPCG